MEIEQYFDPVEFSLYKNSLIDKESLGYFIQKNNQTFKNNNFQKINVVIFGIPNDQNTPNKGTSKAPDIVREHLYSLKRISQLPKIIDLGNLKNGKKRNDIYFALRDIIEYLLNLNITVTIIGGGMDLTVGIIRGFCLNNMLQYSTVDNTANTEGAKNKFNALNYSCQILKENKNIYHINFIGIQNYFVPAKTSEKIKQKNLDVIRLGKYRENPKMIEPVLRDSHFLSFNIGAIRQSEAPGYYNCSPNGFYSEEACQIARYAGLSSQLNVFGLFETNPIFDIREQTSKLSAQIIWYFLEGFSNRKEDHPNKNKYIYKRYLVEIEGLTNPMIFIQNINTQRWWFELEGKNNKNLLISCTYEDYLKARNNEIPEKWWNFTRKNDKLLK